MTSTPPPAPLRGRPQHHARAVRLLQRPALPGAAPVGGKTVDIGVVQPSRRRSRMRADTPTRPRRTRSAPTPTAGSPPSTTNPGKTTTSSRRPAADSAARPWAGSTTCRSPTWRRSRSWATRPTASSSRRAWASARTTRRAPRRRPGRRAVLGHQRPALQLRLLLRLRQRRDRQPRRRQRHHGDHLLRQRHRLVSRDPARPVGHDRPGEQPGGLRQPGQHPSSARTCRASPGDS